MKTALPPVRATPLPPKATSFAYAQDDVPVAALGINNRGRTGIWTRYRVREGIPSSQRESREYRSGATDNSFADMPVLARAEFRAGRRCDVRLTDPSHVPPHSRP